MRTHTLSALTGSDGDDRWLCLRKGVVAANDDQVQIDARRSDIHPGELTGKSIIVLSVCFLD